MILLQNPNMPVPTNAVEIDAAILDIKAHLETGLTWLTNGYGRTYKNLDARNGTTVFYPEAYLGEQNNSQRYINLSPDNDKQGQCFFYVTKENISQFQPGMYSYLSYDTAIIFSVNMELINDALLQTEIYQQILVAQVRDVLTRQLLGSSYQLIITSVDFEFDNVYSEFDLADAQQLEKAPLSHFRFNCTIKLPETCPIPSIIPPVTTCQSLLFDGVNELLQLPINSAFDLQNTHSFTFSAWVKLGNIIGFKSLFRKYDSGINRGYFLIVNGDEIRMDLQNNAGINGAIVETVGAGMIAGNWYHIAGSYDGSNDANNLNLYLNGVLQAKTIIANTLTGTIINTSFLNIGGDLLYFNGNIAKSRAWNVELTSIQVAALYNGGSILTPPVQGANLIIDTDIDNATFGTEWNVPDLTAITAGYTSVNMEVGDRIEDCPS